MNHLMKEALLMLTAVVLGLGVMWFALSFNWSREEMSDTEQTIGTVWMITAVPMYYGVKKLLGLN